MTFKFVWGLRLFLYIMVEYNEVSYALKLICVDCALLYSAAIPLPKRYIGVTGNGIRLFITF